MGGKNYRNTKLQREALQREEANKRVAKDKKRKRGETVLERQAPSLLEAKNVLIVCEGTDTEVDYFNEFKNFFKLSNITLKIVGTGFNTLSLVEKTVELVSKGNYEEVWCVFDKDDFSSQNFNNAILKAISLKFKVAYSNQSFEFWLILHFIEHSGAALHRNYYYRMLKPYLLGYSKKNKHISTKFFEILQAIEDPKMGKTRQTLAIERAKKILKQWEEENPIRDNPAKEESSTTVFELIEELLKYKR